MPTGISSLPLRDVIAPQGVLWWPPAPGWWLLLALSLMLTWLGFRVLRKHLSSPFTPLRKAALHELGTLQADAELSDPLFAEQVSALLKRVALLRYADQQPAGLSGEAWLTFLDRTAENTHFSDLGKRGLLDAQYRTSTEIDRAALVQATRNWIRAI